MIPLDWWVDTLTPPFHKNMVYVMVGYRYICIEWILFWAYMLWNTTIVLPSRPDMQKNVSPLCYGNGIKMKILKPRTFDLYIMERAAS